MVNQKIKILFLCTGNSCRSQMAEGWARHLHGDKIEVWSAGIEVRGVDPYAVRVMGEAGVDLSHHYSKNIQEVIHIPFDYVITVCDHARESCPLFPRPVKKIHQSFDDPPFLARSAKSEEEILEIYRRIRDEIRAFVETLPEILEKQEN